MIRKSTGETNTPVDLGATQQVLVPASEHGLPSTVSAGATVTSNLLASCGYQKLLACLTLDQAGVLTLTRYADQAGLVPLDSGLVATLIAATPNYVAAVDGVPFQSARISIKNNGGVTANVSTLGVLFQSQ